MGFLAHKMKEIGGLRRWANQTDADMANIAEYLAAVTGDYTLEKDFRAAKRFHTNFYQDDTTLSAIKRGVEEVRS